MACPTCNDLYARPYVRPGGRRLMNELRIPTRDCLNSARTTSCDTCKLLRDLVEYFHAGQEDSIYVRGHDDTEGTLSVSIYADMDEDDVTLDLFVPEGKGSGHPLIRSTSRVRRVLETSADNEAFEAITGWIDECDEKHNNCNFDELPPMPTRVIDVALDGDPPYLLETGGKREQYACLSYCWGKTPQLKTTKDKLDGFKKELPMDELSRVVRDAIEICQRLLIPYIWVDALCIVQDDEQDWPREAGRMCDVYSSSYLTIAATGTFDNQDGIFLEQYFGTAERIGTFDFRGHKVFARFTPYKDHLGHPLGLNFDKQYADCLVEKSWILRPHELPLVHRAWTVQERMLSRRVLYYTPEEMWWECDSWWHCECGFADQEKYPDDEDHAEYLLDMDATDDANRGAFDWLRDPHRKVPMSLEKAYHKWGTIITMFAAGNLTHANDKLPALSGLAQQFRRMLRERFDFEEEYFAGVWRRNLERQLLWTVTGHVPNSKALAPRPHDNSIPTWSWLSANGNVLFISDEADQNYKPHFKVLEVSTELVSEDWAGRVNGGKLVLEAFVIHGLKLADRPRDQYDYSVYIETPSAESSVRVSKDTADELTDEPYTCLYAAEIDHRGGEGSMERINTEAGNLFFLLKPSRATEGAFERVGMGVAPLHFMTEGLWDDANKEVVTIV